MHGLHRMFSMGAPQHREVCLLAGLLVLSLLACFAPAIRVDVLGDAGFSDSRSWHGLPYAADVLSNLPFLLMGVWGLCTLRGLRDGPCGARLFFVGLVCTAAGSAFYHWEPNLTRLVADRAGMTVAFAGLLAVAVDERVSRRLSGPVAVFVLVAGLVAAWMAQFNLLPWAVVQFGGMALIVSLAWVRPLTGALGIRLGGVILFYALAKVFEMSDALLFEGTHRLIAGHTVKHVLAALAAWPVIQALRAVQAREQQGLRHNGTAVLH